MNLYFIKKTLANTSYYFRQSEKNLIWSGKYAENQEKFLENLENLPDNMNLLHYEKQFLNYTNNKKNYILSS